MPTRAPFTNPSHDTTKPLKRLANRMFLVTPLRDTLRRLP